MSTGAALVVATPIAILIAALVTWGTNYHVQRRMHEQLRLRQGVDDLKGRLHEFVDLSAHYWILDEPRTQKHRMLEAQMIARKRIIQEEFSGLGNKDERLKKAYKDTKTNRLNLWKAATGGCFQQTMWQADPERIISVAAEACRIIRSLNQAH